MQQRIGRRLGVEPYYRVVEASDGVARLESRPELNRGPGRRILAGGVALLTVAALVAFSGLYAAAVGVGFAAAALGAVVGGLLGAVGYQRTLGGYAVLTTLNRIAIDRTAGAVTFTQGNRVAPERTQRLPLDQVAGLRLRRRAMRQGLAARPVVALELLARDGGVWIVDSAAEPEELRGAAEALTGALDLELERVGA
jgi:hypothetical protein